MRCCYLIGVIGIAWLHLREEESAHNNTQIMFN